MTSFGKSARMCGTLAAAAIAVVAIVSAAPVVSPASAQSYPTRPVRFIVGNPPGGGTDIIGRAVAQGLSDIWGQPTIVENKPGAATIVAAEYVKNSPPDGYTIWVAADVGLANNLFLYSKLPYDPRKDFSLITRLIRVDQMLVVPTNFPVNSVKEFVDLMKKDGAKMNYGSPGVGDGGHIQMEWFKTVAGFQMEHIPHKGMGPVLQSMLAGDLQAVLISTLTVEQYIKSGKMKPIVISGKQRSKHYPDVQTLTEAGYPNVAFGYYLALVVPSGTPVDIINKIATDTKKVLNSQAFLAKYVEPFGYEIIGDTPAEFATFYKNDLIEVEKQVKASGAKAD
jgi:tripartite-type tricarboxylate transporter receptor subunit TctC